MKLFKGFNGQEKIEKKQILKTLTIDQMLQIIGGEENATGIVIK